MAILLDTGVLFACYDRSDAWHERALELISREAGGLLVPAPVIPEVDFLLGKRLGSRAQDRFYEGLSEGDFFVTDLPLDHYGRVLELNRQYEALRLGFVDAAVLAIAEHLGLGRIATTDRRHFGAVSLTLPLELLP